MSYIAAAMPWELDDSAKKKMGKLIEKARKEKGMTRSLLARYLKTSWNLVWKWENGHRVPTGIALRDGLKNILGIDIDKLVLEAQMEAIAKPHITSTDTKPKRKKKTGKQIRPKKRL